MHHQSLGPNKRFEAGGNVHPIAEDVAVLDYDIANIEPDTELDPIGYTSPGISTRHGLLDLYGATQSVHDTGELDE